MSLTTGSNIERAKALYAGLSSGDFQTAITELARPIDFKARYPALTALDAWATMSARC